MTRSDPTQTPPTAAGHSRTRPELALGRGVSLIAVSVALLVASCSGETGVDRETRTATSGGRVKSTSTVAPTGADVEVYDGDDAGFYEVPDPLPPGEPGQLIRYQELGEASGYRHRRVMYHSRDARDRDRAVTGIISDPLAPAPDGGWPVIATAHGTTGLGSKCAPSRFATEAPGYGVEGVRVVTDYIGLGPVGEVHSYLSGVSEGRSVIDSVRAARNLEGVAASERWVVVGHSQGGHAALFTHELAPDYAPELEHLGSVVSAPASVLDRRFGPGDEVVPRMVALMALYGIAQDHPELDVADYAGAELAAGSEIVTTGCTQDVIDAFVTIPPEKLYRLDPMDDPGARAVVMENDPGTVATDVPMMLLYGDKDWWVVPDRVRYLFGQLCANGQNTELVAFPDADHGNLLDQASATVTTGLQDRLAGNDPTNTCPEA